MDVSYLWLKELCPFDAAAPDVASALTDRGLTVDSVADQGQDTRLEIDVPANRPDCLGHRGLARELSAAFGVDLAASAVARQAGGPSVEDALSVEIADPDLCGRFSARIVRGVRVRKSPDWVVKRLEVCGLRSINNVVDVSNLVMLETGNPIHFFDLPKIAEQRIIVRRARRGETLVTLEGQERKLDEEMLLVADGRRGVALAGVMGGAETEIGDTTRDVLIEAAWFLPPSIRRTARRTGLSTDASQRFERGVDPEGVIAAQELAVRLLVELADGIADTGQIDVYPGRAKPGRLTLQISELRRLLGYSPDPKETLAAFDALGLAPRASGESIEVRVPSWRVDLERQADLVEEVARHLGYHRIPSTLGGLPHVVLDTATDDRAERARDLLARCGFNEAYGYAMIAPGEDDRFVEEAVRAPTPLNHPIVENMAVLRRSILPGLLRAVDLNVRRGNRDVRLFEVGRVFHPKPRGFPDEPLRAGILWTGRSRPTHWSEADRAVAWFDLLGVVEDLLDGLVPGHRGELRPGATRGHHPGLAAHWVLEQTAVAWAGALHPELQAAYHEPVWLAEVALDRLPDAPPRASYCPLPNLGAVERDIAVVLPSDRTWREVRDALQAIPSPVPAQIDAVDRYEGRPLPEGSAAVTVRVRLQPDRTSLTEETIEAYRRQLVSELTGPLGLEIRG